MLYAIGEIALVMIGILLALQVNTWNNNRELKKEEFKVLKSLHQEFNENLIKFDSSYSFHLRRKKSIETVMSINLESLSTDSLLLLNDRVNGNYTFDPFQGIYNSVISSGKIELISNDILKNKISRIQDLLMDYKEEEDETKNTAIEKLYPFIFKLPMKSFNYDSENKQITEESIQIKKNYIKIFQSQEYNNMMILLRGWMSSIFEEGPILREEMIFIINLLESEIEKYK